MAKWVQIKVTTNQKHALDVAREVLANYAGQQGEHCYGSAAYWQNLSYGDLIDYLACAEVTHIARSIARRERARARRLQKMLAERGINGHNGSKPPDGTDGKGG